RAKATGSGLPDGRRLPPGTSRLALPAAALAGNRSKLAPAGTVRIRYVALPSRSFRVRPNRTLAISVSTDAAHVRYTLRRGASVVVSGSSNPRLRLRAPKKPGWYVLVIEEAGHKAVAAVVVANR